MDSNLLVESELGKGSIFSFTINMKLAAEQSLKSEILPEELKGLRVLVVDDNAAAREILSAMLASYSFRVTAVDSGAASLAELQQATAAGDGYAMVCMDWKMPEMDGFEAIQRIRADTSLSQPPAIIMVTAFGREELRQQIDELANTAFLTKPVQPSGLFNTVLELFGKADHRSSRHSKSGLPQMKGLQQIRGARVLVVEDNPINQQVAREIIEQAGVLVEVVANGSKAVEAVENGAKFDVVFMDLQMPEMDGYEATRRIRQLKSHAELPIIAMTAYALADEREKCLSAGMDDHLPKPIDPKMLYAALITWIKPGNRTAVDSSAEFSDKNNLFPESLPGLDLADALQRVGGNRALFCHIVSDFKDQNQTVIDDIRKAICNNDHERATALVHTLKGVSGSIGAKNLFASVSDLEALLRGGNGSDCSFLLMTMEQNLKEVFKSAGILEASTPDMPVHPASTDELRPLIEELAASLMDNDLKAIQILERLDPLIEHSPDRGDIKKYIARLDFTKALSLLKRIAAKNHIEL